MANHFNVIRITKYLEARIPALSLATFHLVPTILAGMATPASLCPSLGLITSIEVHSSGIESISLIMVANHLFRAGGVVALITIVRLLSDRRISLRASLGHNSSQYLRLLEVLGESVSRL